MLDHDAIVENWKQNAQDHDDDNYKFLRSLKMRSHKKVDRIALQLHQEVFEIVDCTRCANCCRTMRPVFTEEDITRIAQHRGMAKKDFIAAYLEWDDEEQCHRTKAAPCPFLGSDGKCTIYDVRPETCKEFPYTDKPDLAFNTMSRANHALACPAAFYVVEELKNRLG